MWEEHLKDPLAPLAKALELAFGFTVCRCQPLSSQWLSASLVRKFCKRCGKGPVGKAPCQDPWDVVRLRTSSCSWNVQGEAGFSSSCGVCSPRAGRDPRARGKVHPLWKEVSCSGNESTVSYEVYEHNNECRAIEVIGQVGSSEVVALFLEDWELGRVALSCHMTMDLLCQEMRDDCWDSSESLDSP